LGEELLQNGRFLLRWLRAVAMNPFICMPMVATRVREKYLPSLAAERGLLEPYLNEVDPPLSLKTP
jgi:hypothetical protein